MAALSSWAELVVVDGVGGASIVLQHMACERWYVVVTRRRSTESARAWIEAHYEGVLWRSFRECTALVGRLSGRGR